MHFHRVFTLANYLALASLLLPFHLALAYSRPSPFPSPVSSPRIDSPGWSDIIIVALSIAGAIYLATLINTLGIVSDSRLRVVSYNRVRGILLGSSIAGRESLRLRISKQVEINLLVFCVLLPEIGAALRSVCAPFSELQSEVEILLEDMRGCVDDYDAIAYGCTAEDNAKVDLIIELISAQVVRILTIYRLRLHEANGQNLKRLRNITLQIISVPGSNVECKIPKVPEPVPSSMRQE